MPRLSLSWFFLAFGLGARIIGHCKAEPPNPLYQYHMNDATAVYNMTLFILPCPKDIVETLAKYPLLPPTLPTSEGTYPLVLQFGKLSDIRQSLAQIPKLMSASVIIPNVDRLNNGNTSFARTECTFTDQIVPAAVSSLIEGYRNEVATFTPSNEAFGINEQVYHYQVKQDITITLPSPIGGPGFSMPTFDAQWRALSPSEKSPYPRSAYEALLNGPIFGNGLGCGTITTFFNYTFTQPTYVRGNITMYGSPGRFFPKIFQFTNVPGLSATVAEIQGTFPPVDCRSFV